MTRNTDILELKRNLLGKTEQITERLLSYTITEAKGYIQKKMNQGFELKQMFLQFDSENKILLSTIEHARPELENRFMNVAEVHKLITSKGFAVSVNSVRNSLDSYISLGLAITEKSKTEQKKVPFTKYKLITKIQNQLNYVS